MGSARVTRGRKYLAAKSIAFEDKVIAPIIAYSNRDDDEFNPITGRNPAGSQGLHGFCVHFVERCHEALDRPQSNVGFRHADQHGLNLGGT